MMMIHLFNIHLITSIEFYDERKKVFNDALIWLETQYQYLTYHILQGPKGVRRSKIHFILKRLFGHFICGFVLTNNSLVYHKILVHTS